jgi:NAD(P)-dependent dehydrogenase (short-subunit alcohol dehydrogenase family)
MSIPARALVSASRQGVQLTRRVLGTASLERAVEGKVVVFTGLGSAVERGAADTLERAGATVVRLPGTPADDDAARRRVDSLLEEHGRVDLLVNGASTGGEATGFEDFQLAMQAGYYAPVRLALGVLPGMRARRSGHVVNVRMPVSRTDRVGQAHRLSAHAALSSFSRSVASEVLHDGVAISAYELPRPDETDDAQGAADLCRVIAERPRRAGGGRGPAPLLSPLGPASLRAAAITALRAGRRSPSSSG